MSLVERKVQNCDIKEFFILIFFCLLGFFCGHSEGSDHVRDLQDAIEVTTQPLSNRFMPPAAWAASGEALPGSRYLWKTHKL